MNINKDLNLVMSMTDSKGPFTVHSIPLPIDVFKNTYRFLRELYLEFSDDVRGSVSIVHFIYAEKARELGIQALADELLSTIRGATTIIRGGNPILLQHSDIDDEYKQEVLNKIVFFTAWRPFVLPSELQDWLPAISSVLNLELSKSTVQEILSSQPTPVTTSKTTLSKKESITKNPSPSFPT